MERETKVTLSSIGKGGAAAEIFDALMKDVINNITDQNTSPTAARKIALTFTIKPEDDRESATVSIQGKTTLAPVKPFGTTIFLGKERDGEMVAVEYDPKQRHMFAPEIGENVVPISRKEENA